MSGTRWIACVVGVLAAGVALSSRETLRIVPSVTDKDVRVSVELADGYTEAIRTTIKSGLRTTFTYDVELRLAAPIWLDRTIAAMVVTASDEYDNLTRRHRLSRTVDGRVEEALVTEDEALVQKWLTTFTRVRLCPTSKLEANREYYVRLKARARPSGASLLGIVSTVSNQVKFTFIP